MPITPNAPPAGAAGKRPISPEFSPRSLSQQQLDRYKNYGSKVEQFRNGLALQKQINDRNFKKPAAPAAPSPASDFVGPNKDGSSGAPSLLPAPAMGAAPAADPNEALNQFGKEQLGGAEYRINRRHPARTPKIAAGSPYQGMTAGQAQLKAESDFRGMPDSGKAAALGRSQALQYTPPAAAPQVQNAGAPSDAFLPRPMMQKAPVQPMGTMASTLSAPQKATGQPLGSTRYTNLPSRPMRR